MTAPMIAGCGPVEPLTEDRVREICREELRAARPPAADDLLGAREAATLDGVRDLGTLTRRVKAGTFPPPDAYAGELRMWKRSTIEKAIAAQAVAPRPRPRRGVAAWTKDQHAERERKKAKAQKRRRS